MGALRTLAGHRLLSARGLMAGGAVLGAVALVIPAASSASYGTGRGAYAHTRTYRTHANRTPASRTPANRTLRRSVARSYVRTTRSVPTSRWVRTSTPTYRSGTTYSSGTYVDGAGRRWIERTPTTRVVRHTSVPTTRVPQATWIERRSTPTPRVAASGSNVEYDANGQAWIRRRVTSASRVTAPSATPSRIDTRMPTSSASAVPPPAYDTSEVARHSRSSGVGSAVRSLRRTTRVIRTSAGASVNADNYTFGRDAYSSTWRDESAVPPPAAPRYDSYGGASRVERTYRAPAVPAERARPVYIETYVPSEPVRGRLIGTGTCFT